MKPLLFTLAVLAAGLAAACSGNSNDGGVRTDSAGSTGSVGSVGAPPIGPDVASESAALADSSLARLVVTSRLSLEVTDLRDAYSRTTAAAGLHGGFIADGRIASSAREDQPSEAFLRLRVPYEQHDGLIEDLRAIGTRVTTEETTTTEVTGEYTDLQSRITNLRRSESQYQSFLDRAVTIEEVLDVSARLDEVRGEIEQLQGRVNLLADQSDFATVSVSLSVPPVVAQTETGGGLQSPVTVFGNALDSSLDVAHALANVSAVLAVVALWGVPATLAVLVLKRPIQRLFQASRARFG